MKNKLPNKYLSITRDVCRLLLLLLFILNSLQASAQEDKREKIEAMKVSFITQKIDLSSKEAQVFWPLYNDYSDKIQALRKLKRKDQKSTRLDIDALSESEAEQLIDNEIQLKIQEAELAKEYHGKFKQSIGAKKVAKLYRAEEDFKRELLKQLQNK
jgi:hypothetical protein